MAVYLDISFLVPLFFHETASAAVLARASGENELWISHWTLAEFSSATAFEPRTAQTDETTARQATARLQAILTAHGLIVAELRAADFERRVTSSHRDGSSSNTRGCGQSCSASPAAGGGRSPGDVASGRRAIAQDADKCATPGSRSAPGPQ